MNLYLNHRATFFLVLLAACTGAIATSTADARAQCPILWNKLGSEAEVTHSGIGPDGIIVGDIDYLPGQFDNGFKPEPRTGDPDIPDNFIRFNDLNLGQQGTIEFWYQPDWVSGGHCRTIVEYGKTNRTYLITLGYNDWQNRCWVSVVNDDLTDLQRVGKYIVPANTPEWSTTEPFHVAIVWDGTAAEAADKVRLFLNGNERGTLGVVNGSPAFDDWDSENYMYLASRMQEGDWHRHNWEGSDGVIDNIKIWDYAKTDFSDRFTEAPNRPPVCDADGPYDEECQGSVTTVDLDGAGSSDPDGDPLTYSWTTDCPGGSFDDPGSATPVLTLTSGGSCLVDCTVTLTVTDSLGAISTCAATVTVEDTTGPTVACPEDLVVECDGAGNQAERSAWEAGFTATDACNLLIDLSHCGYQELCGSTFLLWCQAEVYDVCWNIEEAQCGATFEVEDTIAPEITCPADVTVTCGDPTDPDATGWATATDICDDHPAYPAISYSDVDTPTTCPADPVMYTITRTWTATDQCGNSSTCDQTITVMKLVPDLDIKPGSCPNSFNRGSHGVLPVGLLGTYDFDVTTVDLDSVRLSRADCLGGEVAPNEGPPGPHSTITDVGTPFGGQPCDCHELEGDGIDDLSMKFKTDDLVPALELDSLNPGALVELVVSGTLADGCEFIATDCVRLVPPGTPPGAVSVESNVEGVWVDVDPLDDQLDGGGFGSFTRTFPQSTLVTLTASPTHDGRPFLRWRIDGVVQSPGSPTLELTIDGDTTTVRAEYRNLPGPQNPNRPTSPSVDMEDPGIPNDGEDPMQQGDVG